MICDAPSAGWPSHHAAAAYFAARRLPVAGVVPELAVVAQRSWGPSESTGSSRTAASLRLGWLNARTAIERGKVRLGAHKTANVRHVPENDGWFKELCVESRFMGRRATDKPVLQRLVQPPIHQNVRRLSRWPTRSRVSLWAVLARRIRLQPPHSFTLNPFNPWRDSTTHGLRKTGSMARIGQTGAFRP